MRQIGLFGGSFDPIHFGHLNLAIEILEKTKLDEILFCPAFVSPYKVDTPPKASPYDRLEMVKLATSDIKKFSVLDEEVLRDEVSYTIDTLKALKKRFNGEADLNLIIDQDLLEKFCGWKNYQEIFEIANIIIGCRSNFNVSELPDCLKNLSNKKIIETNQFEISSTMIRRRLLSGLYVGHVMPAKVLDYIYKHRLY